MSPGQETEAIAARPARGQTEAQGNGQASTTTPEAAATSLGWLEILVEADTFHPLRSAVGDGVIAGSARVGGRPVFVWAQDFAHHGGTLGAAGGETIARTLRCANRAGVPVIGVPHSGGARLQEGVAALSAYGAIFREQARARVPQIAVIPGACAGGAAYSPALGDFVVMVGPQARMFLTGPKVTREAIGEQISAEDLGGPRVHRRNGVAHLIADDDPGAVRLVRELLSFMPSAAGEYRSRADRVPSADPAAGVPSSTRRVYDIRDVITAIVDDGCHLELAGRWAPNLVTTLARINGRSVGVLANQPKYRGGTIDSPASEKGTWFVNLCDRLSLPIVVLVDTPGFMPGAGQERSGVIRHGAALLRAFAQATTPKLTVTLRQAYGGAHIAMNSRDLGADLTLAWPGAQIGIMGARQAVRITERRAIEKNGDLDELAREYAATQIAVSVAVTNGFIDEIVTPLETRERLARALELHR